MRTGSPRRSAPERASAEPASLRTTAASETGPSLSPAETVYAAVKPDSVTDTSVVLPESLTSAPDMAETSVEVEKTSLTVSPIPASCGLGPSEYISSDIMSMVAGLHGALTVRSEASALSELSRTPPASAVTCCGSPSGKSCTVSSTVPPDASTADVMASWPTRNADVDTDESIRSSLNSTKMLDGPVMRADTSCGGTGSSMRSICVVSASALPAVSAMPAPPAITKSSVLVCTEATVARSSADSCSLTVSCDAEAVPPSVTCAPPPRTAMSDALMPVFWIHSSSTMRTRPVLRLTPTRSTSGAVVSGVTDSAPLMDGALPEASETAPGSTDTDGELWLIRAWRALSGSDIVSSEVRSPDRLAEPSCSPPAEIPDSLDTMTVSLNRSTSSPSLRSSDPETSDGGVESLDTAASSDEASTDMAERLSTAPACKDTRAEEDPPMAATSRRRCCSVSATVTVLCDAEACAPCRETDMEIMDASGLRTDSSNSRVSTPDSSTKLADRGTGAVESAEVLKLRP